MLHSVNPQKLNMIVVGMCYFCKDKKDSQNCWVDAQSQQQKEDFNIWRFTC